MKRLPRFAVLVLLAAWPAGVCAGTIDTGFIQQTWPRQIVRYIEAGKHEVRWRQRTSKRDGVFAGVRFEALRDRETVWKRATDYHDIGANTPGVTAVRFLEITPDRQVLEVDVKVLWKTLRLTFEVEREPPTQLRFRVTNSVIGEYRGVCMFESASEARTAVELSTWLKPARPIPLRLIVMIERMTFLRGAEHFLDSLEQQPLAA